MVLFLLGSVCQITRRQTKKVARKEETMNLPLINELLEKLSTKVVDTMNDLPESVTTSEERELVRDDIAELNYTMNKLCDCVGLNH